MVHDAEWQHGVGKKHRLRNEGSNYSDSSSIKANSSWMVTAGVFVIQLTIPTIFSSYGVQLSRLIENNYFLKWHGLLPPMMYVTTRSFIDPVCRNVISGQSLNSRKTAMCGVFVIASSIALNALVQSLFLQVITLGIFGGLCTSVVVTQAEAVLCCHFPAQRNLTQVLCQLGLALGYFGMPLLMNGLISQYGIHGSFMLHSGVVLQAFVGAALLRPPQDNDSDAPFIHRPRTYTVVDDIELSDLSGESNGHSGHSPLLSPARSWKNPAEVRYDTAQTSSPVISIRQKNVNGVDILPEIPEESEESNSDCDGTNNISHTPQEIKNKFKYNVNTSFSNQENLGATRTYNEKENVPDAKYLQKWRNVYLQSEEAGELNKIEINGQTHTENQYRDSYQEETRHFSSFVSCSEHMRFQRLESMSENQISKQSLLQRVTYICFCRCCNKASLYKFYLTLLNFPNDVHFYLIVPMISAIKVPDFFPAVFLHTVLRVCPIVFTIFIPFLTRERIATSTSQEGAFTISVAAFSWLCFLLFSPCFLQAKIKTKKLIYFLGSMSLSAGLYIVSTTKSHGYIVFGCAFIGVGHGATSETVTSIFEADVGTRKFIKLQGPLDVVSGCFALMMSFILGALLHEENGIFNCFITLAILQMATSVVWIISLLRRMLQRLRSITGREWHPGGDYLTPG